jgi:hypothetical protein
MFRCLQFLSVSVLPIVRRKDETRYGRNEGTEDALQ